MGAILGGRGRLWRQRTDEEVVRGADGGEVLLLLLGAGEAVEAEGGPVKRGGFEQMEGVNSRTKV